MGPSGSGKSTLMHCLAGLDAAGRAQLELLARRSLDGFRAAAELAEMRAVAAGDQHAEDGVPDDQVQGAHHLGRLHPEDGWAVQRLYTDDRSLDERLLVGHGDTVLVRRGYHPVVTAPGYDLYYLNVMAGPGERAWRVTDDPDHAWIRDTWPAQQLAPRLPLLNDLLNLGLPDTPLTAALDPALRQAIKRRLEASEW